MKKSIFILLFVSSFSLFAGGHYKPRDIDRALYFTDIVLRSLFPSTVVISQPQPVVTYSTPVYQETVVTTPVIRSTIYSPAPVYIAPQIHYSAPRYRPPAPSYRRPVTMPRSVPRRYPSSRGHRR